VKRITIFLLAALFACANTIYAQSEGSAPELENDAGGAAAATEAAPSEIAPETEPQAVPEALPAAAPAEASPSYRLIVNFEENSLELAPLSAAALDSMSVLFAKHNRNRYEVHGYSCPTIAGQKVIRLSLQRVERVVEHLVSLGIPGENILTVVNAPKTSGGANKPCAEDRRVDIISTGYRWRNEEPPPAKQSEPELRVSDSLNAVMTELKRKLAESEASASAARAAPEPPPVQPVKAEEGKQAVAVYMAGAEPPAAKGVHTIMGGELARVLSESDKYTAVDRTEVILQQLDKEHVYQRSGAVDDDQIKAIGHQLGVQYLCISNINPVGKRYYLDTRLVDIVTAEISRSVTATSTLKDAGEMAKVGRNIALELLEAEKTMKQRKLRKTIFRYTAIGLDVLGAGMLAYGYMENGNVVKHKEAIGADDEGREIISNGPEAQRAATRRNVGYIVGGVLVAAGVSIHIIF